MPFKEKLPVSYLLFTARGRINRLTFWNASLFIWTSFYVLFNVIESAISFSATWAVYPLLFWALISTAIKRLHDSNKYGTWLFLILIPVFGPLILIYFLGFKKGNREKNSFGVVPGSSPDYFRNNEVRKSKNDDDFIVNDITQLNPIVVANVVTPETVDELRTIVAKNSHVSVGGGRFSMGGQTASEKSVHVDMRKFNRVIDFSKEKKTITVEAGIRWCDIQKYIDEFELSVMIMQTYANFTVGGSLSVNCHGRYIGLGPVILSVRSIQIIVSNGDLIKASPETNPELFYACIGCYNAVGIIAIVEFNLAENVNVKRSDTKMNVNDYMRYFFDNIRERKEVIFHNGDIYPPKFDNVRAVSWTVTEKKPTEKSRLMPLASSYPIERYFIGAFSKGVFGKWRRQYIIDPILYSRKKIHRRNYEAGYDVLELEPASRKDSTYVLQEYFIPINRFDEFAKSMSEIFRRYHVNVINVSIRHAIADPGSLLAWAREEVFAFVVWYKQGTKPADREKVGDWTRELIDASIKSNGSYYLPYQAHATKKQFHSAFPDATKLFELKNKLDPEFKFRNILWNTYYKPN